LLLRAKRLFIAAMVANRVAGSNPATTKKKKIRLNVIQIIGDALAGATTYLSENTKDHF
jgi:hypothetical protein